MATTHANTNQHTPGPWKVVPTMNGHAVTDADNRSVINCSSPQQEANARLIAAAPEMRQTIEDLADILTDYLAYAAHMRKDGRGYSTTDTAGRIDANVLAGARALLATLKGA